MFHLITGSCPGPKAAKPSHNSLLPPPYLAIGICSFCGSECLVYSRCNGTPVFQTVPFSTCQYTKHFEDHQDVFQQNR